MKKKNEYVTTILNSPSINNAVQYFPGEEVFDHEGMECLTDWGIVAQEHIPNVKEEYRLIASNGIIHSIRKRGIKDQALKQAVPSGLLDAPSITRTSFTQYLESLGIAFNDIEKLTEVAGNAPHSFDLFITEDNKWGFFEYSNQFCTQDIPTELLKEIHLSYLHSLTFDSAPITSFSEAKISIESIGTAQHLSLDLSNKDFVASQTNKT